MKQEASNQKTHQQDAQTVDQPASAGPHGMAVMPPDYGMDLLDRGFGGVLQTKLIINKPGDIYEQEADRVAEELMSISPPATTNIQRSPNGVPQVRADLKSPLNASKGGGSPLPDEVRSFMESRFRTDFSQVRVHTGSDAVQMNWKLGAQAFTHKNDIYFGAGKAPAKDKLTGHELTHVIQQTGKIQAQSMAFRPDISSQLVTHFAPQGLVQMSRTPEEEASLIRDIIRAIAANESGGAAQAQQSRMGTSAGIPASYASSTQMIASHAVVVLREHSAYAAGYGIRSQDLRRADRIMHASQRIWEAIVIRGHNIHEINEADLVLTGFTVDELTRMMRFGEIRRLLLANRERFNTIKAIVEARLNEQATRLTGRLTNPRDGGSTTEGTDTTLTTEALPTPGQEEVSTPESSIEFPNDLAERALALLSQQQRAPVEILISFSYPEQWGRWTEARRSQWLNRQRRAARNARGRIEEVASLASEAFLAHELSGNEHIRALNLRETDIRAYIHQGRFNRFPEDKAGWNRLALRYNLMPASSGSGDSTRTYDAAIAEATQAEGGWALSRVEYEAWIRDWIISHPAESDEQVVRAAAAHNGNSHDYPDRIWQHFQRLRRQEGESAR